MFINTFGAVTLTGLLACVVTTVGIYIISKYERWGREHSGFFMPFAAGVLIAVSFLHIIPKSFQMNGRGPVFLLAGFLATYLFNRFLTTYVCHKSAGTNYTAGIIPTSWKVCRWTAPMAVEALAGTTATNLSR
jgi:zinc and cadmium transporter